MTYALALFLESTSFLGYFCTLLIFFDKSISKRKFSQSYPSCSKSCLVDGGLKIKSTRYIHSTISNNYIRPLQVGILAAVQCLCVCLLKLLQDKNSVPLYYNGCKAYTIQKILKYIHAEVVEVAVTS